MDLDNVTTRGRPQKAGGASRERGEQNTFWESAHGQFIKKKKDLSTYNLEQISFQSDF